MSIALRHTPIRRKLLTLALAAGLAFVTVSALYVLSWRDLEKVSARVSSTYIPTLRDGAAALVSVSSLGTELFRYVNHIEPSAYRVADALEGARAALQRIARSDIPPEIGANIKSLLPQVTAQEEGLRRLTSRVERDDVLGIGQEHTRMAAAAGVMLRGVERINGQLLDSIVQENQAGARKSLERAAMAAAFSIFCILAALLCMGLVGRDLEAGLAQLREAARRYASGESAAITPLERNDEVGQLSRYLNELSTQVKEIEAQLRERLKFINDVFDSMPLSLAFRDMQGRFRMVNRTWERYFGFSREQTLGRTPADLAAMPGGADASEVARIAAEDRRALDLGPGKSTEPREIVLRGRHHLHSRYYLQSRTAMGDALGNLTGVLIAGLDTTAQHEMQQVLETQQQRLELVVRAAKAGIIDTDTVRKTAWYSDRLKELLGYPPDTDTSSWTFFDRMHPEDRPRIFDAFTAHLKGKDPAVRDSLMLEYRLLRLDGSIIWVQGMGLSLRDATGRSTRFLASITDVSERRQQEEALRDQIKLTRDLIDGNPNPVYLKDSECRFLEINTAYSQLTRVNPEQAIGRTVFDLYKTENAATFDRQDRDLLARGEGSIAIEVDYEFPDKRRHFLMSKTILKNADGVVRGLVGTLTDITHIKEFEAELRNSEERLRFWLGNIPIPIAIYDPEGGVQFLNSAFVATFGWTLEEMRGKRMPFVPENRKEQLAGVLQNLLTVGKDAFETERITKDGRILDIYISTGMARAPDGTPRATMVSLMDVTERKRMERELSASREDALQAARAKSAFLAAMSHEIRTPLNGVLGMAGLLADTGLTEEQREYVETIRVSGDALLSVINDILDYSKIESGRMEVESEPFEPMRAVEEALEILGERARGKRLELAAEAEDSVPAWVRGDFARLRQVLVNLVGNAVKFTERGEVVVRLRAPSAGMLEIEVSDTGIGIAQDRLGHLFQAFTQADASTTRKYGGTGLGLAISKRLVELMGGDLRADSEPGRGSTFVFGVSAPSCEALSSAAIAAQPVELAGRRVLVVDDNATNLRILRRQLERWGAVPVAAPGGPAALALLESKERFDAALLDYHMPDMDGVMLARRIKALAKSLPLLLLSSSMYRRAEEAEAGLFVVQLLKPVRQQQLREALVAALGGALPGRKGRGSRVVAGVAAQEGLRVLVVDDVDTNCRLAQALLRKFGHVSEVATSGLQAIEMAAAGRHDVILMDVQMPDIDGMEAARRIRERLGAASPRIIAVTANAMPGDRERCLAAGMDDYLSKPIQHEALRAAIDRSHRGAARAAAPASAGAIDWRRIESLEPFDFDGSMVAGAIAAFLADAPARIGAIVAAQESGNAAGLAAAAHALKGAAANIGAARVQELSQDIESGALEGRLEGARVSIGALDKALADVRAALASRPKRS